MTVTEWPPCDYRERCGCERPRCYHVALGPQFAEPEMMSFANGEAGMVYRVTPGICGRCDAQRKQPPPAPAPDWPPCPYRDTSCSCSRRKCLHRAHGPAFGAAEPETVADGSTLMTWRVTVDACLRCVAV